MLHGFEGFLLGVIMWVLQDCYRGGKGELQGYYRMTGVLQRHYRVLQVSYVGVKGVFNKHSRDGTRVFQGCTGILQGCYR